MNAALRNGMIVAAVALSAALLLGAVQWLTQARIAANEQGAAERELLAVLPPESYDNHPLQDSVAVQGGEFLGLDDTAQIHIARRAGIAVAAVIPAVARDGYSGPIELQVAVRADCSAINVRVQEHHETAGLGDRVADVGWLRQFIGKSSSHPASEQWTVKKEGGAFDQFTGATLTPRAVAKTVQRVLQYCDAHREHIFTSSSVQGAGA